jgi:hypothetical protein
MVVLIAAGLYDRVAGRVEAGRRLDARVELRDLVGVVPVQQLPRVQAGARDRQRRAIVPEGQGGVEAR